MAGRRVWWLSRLVRTGQPAPGRMDGVPARLRAEVAEVFGQRKLLTWSAPGVAHFLTFWGFIVLILTIIEAWGGLFDRDFHIPGIGRWPAIGFIEDLFAVGVLVGIVAFAVLRIRQAPESLQLFFRLRPGTAAVIAAPNSGGWMIAAPQQSTRNPAATPQAAAEARQQLAQAMGAASDCDTHRANQLIGRAEGLARAGERPDYRCR